MKDGDLRALLAAEFQDASPATGSSKLSSDRSDSMAYYLGDMSRDMPAAPGRSQAVSMDVSDTIEGMMPQLMEIFTAGDEVFRFEPVGPEDVNGAKQETDYINHVFMNENPGFLVLYQFIKDALLQKVGIVKVWSEKEDKEERETYYDKTDDEFALIVSDPDVEVVEHTVHPAGEDTEEGGYGGEAPSAPVPSMAALPSLHDVTVVTKKTKVRHRAMGVPPEEFGFRRDTRQLKDANYCYHKTPRSVGELITLGYDVEQIKGLPSFRGWTSDEQTTRDTVDENSGAGDADANEISRMVEIVEHYIVMDYKGEDKPCLYRVTTGGSGGESQILIRDGKRDIIEFDAIPFACASPIIQPHRLVGRSVADLVMDIQRIKTALMRQMLDNQYLANNPRVEVAEVFASDNTLDDLLVSRPGGIVRTKQPGGINWQQVPNISATIYPALEYMDGVKEWRTGVVRQAQGIDADSLQYQSATAVSQTFTASQARIRLIARVIAEGVKDIAWLLHGTIKKHADKPSVVRLRNQWVTIDPRNWKTRNDITVNVGLGTGSKAERINQLMAVMNVQKELLIGGKTNLVTDANIYNSAKDLTVVMGKPDTETYFSDPAKQPPPPAAPPDPKIIEIQMKAQLEATKAQVDAAHQQAKMRADMTLEQQKFEHDKELATLKAHLDISERQHSQQMAERKHQLDESLAMRKLELDAAKLAMTPSEEEKAQTRMAPFHAIMQKHNEQSAKHDALAQHTAVLAAHHAAQLHQPTEFIRDASGRLAGAKHKGQMLHFKRDASGRLASIHPA